MSDAGAYAQLARLADAGVDLGARFGPLTRPEDARPASVLMLFGTLDGVPSAHRAYAVSRDLDVLLLARAQTLRSHPGQIAFPGGRQDPGDDGPVAAALREAREETGLDPDGVEVLGTLGSLPLDHSRHEVTPVLGWWRQPSAVGVVDEGESSAVFRVPVADLLNPRNRGTTVLRRGGMELRTPGFRLENDAGVHVVWGFTAMLLDGLFDELGWTEPWDRESTVPLLSAPV